MKKLLILLLLLTSLSTKADDLYSINSNLSLTINLPKKIIDIVRIYTY